MNASDVLLDHPLDPTTDPIEIQARYVSLWNEPDRDLRYRMIDDLFTTDVVHRLLPPAEMHEQARLLGFPNPTLDIVGRIDMRARVDRAHAEFVAPGHYTFRSSGAAQRVGALVKLEWDMVDVATGDVVGGGTDVVQLTPEGRISSDHQFVR